MQRVKVKINLLQNIVTCFLKLYLQTAMMKANMLACLFCLSFSSNSIIAQAPLADSSHYNLALNHLYTSYINAIGENTHLLNGSEYNEDHPGISGNQYWYSNIPQPGSIYYDGVFYRDVLLMYDIVRSDVVIRNKQQLSIKLLNEKINYFILGNKVFRHIKRDSTDN